MQQSHLFFMNFLWIQNLSNALQYNQGLGANPKKFHFVYWSNNRTEWKIPSDFVKRAIREYVVGGSTRIKVVNIILQSYA